MRRDITEDEEQLEYIAQWLVKKQMKKTARAVKRQERRGRREGYSTAKNPAAPE